MLKSLLLQSFIMDCSRSSLLFSYLISPLPFFSCSKYIPRIIIISTTLKGRFSCSLCAFFYIFLAFSFSPVNSLKSFGIVKEMFISCLFQRNKVVSSVSCLFLIFAPALLPKSRISTHANELFLSLMASSSTVSTKAKGEKGTLAGFHKQLQKALKPINHGFYS